MSLRFGFTLFFSLLLLLFTSTTAFNVTKILQEFPDFAVFNNYLSDNQIAANINNRSTVTILAVPNGNMSELLKFNQQKAMIKKIMSIHVLLDYFDPAKLHNLLNQTITVTTLYQTTGLAQGQEGFMNLSTRIQGEVLFGSSVSGSTYDSSLVESLDSEPFDISVLHVTNLIMPNYDFNPNTTILPPQPPARSPVQPPTNSPLQPPTNSPLQPPTNSPLEPPATSPVKPPARSPTPSSGAPTPSNAPPNPDSPATNAPGSSTEPADIAQAPHKGSGEKSVIEMKLVGLATLVLLSIW